jgi:hypothetical protein
MTFTVSTASTASTVSPEAPTPGALARAGGYAAIACAGLLTLGAAAQFQQRNLPGQILYSAGYALAPFMLAALYARQARRAGVLGGLAFGLALAGTLVNLPIAGMWLGITAKSKELHDAFAVVAMALRPAMVLIYGNVVGMVLFGIAAARAKVFPTWSGIAVTAGMLVAIPAEVSQQGQWTMALWPIGTLIMGAGLAGMGYVLAGQPGRPGRRGRG